MNIGIHEYITLIILSLLMIPVFKPLFFGRTMPNLSPSLRFLLFPPSVFALIVYYFRFNLFKDAPIYLKIAVSLLEAYIIFYPMCSLTPSAYFVPKKLTVISNGNTAEISRKQMTVVNPAISYIILPYAEALPQNGRDTVSFAKLVGEAQGIIYHKKLAPYIVTRSDGMYVAVWNGQLVKLKDIKL